MALTRYGKILLQDLRILKGISAIIWPIFGRELRNYLRFIRNFAEPIPTLVEMNELRGVYKIEKRDLTNMEKPRNTPEGFKFNEAS